MSNLYLEKFKDISQSEAEGGAKLPDLEKFVGVISQPNPSSEVKAAEKRDHTPTAEKQNGSTSREPTPEKEKNEETGETKQDDNDAEAATAEVQEAP